MPHLLMRADHIRCFCHTGWHRPSALQSRLLLCVSTDNMLRCKMVRQGRTCSCSMLAREQHMQQGFI